MKRITQFILCIVLAVSAYGQGVGGNSVPRTVSGISAALDLISSTQGTVFYRGASGWEALPPGTSGQLFSTQGAAANPIWVTATGGAGDVNGPTLGTATDNAIVRFDGTGGKTIQNSAVTVADTTGAMTWSGDATLSGGSSGASLVLGQGASGAIALSPKGTSSVSVSNTSLVGSVVLGAGAEIYGDAATTIISSYGSRPMRFYLNGSEKAQFAPTTGNLLIGTTTDITGTGGLKVAGTSTASSTTTGALQVGSNIGLSGNAGGASYFGGSVISAGEVSAPGLAVDADNGFYRKGTDNIGLALNGVFAMDFDDGVKRIDIQSAFTFRALGAAQVNGVLNVTNTTSASSSTVGALTIGNGTAATNVAIGGGNINAGGTLTTGGAATFAGAVTATLGTNYPPQTAPASPASGWVLYTDSGDGNKLKAKASTGTVVTIGTP